MHVQETLQTVVFSTKHELWCEPDQAAADIQGARSKIKRRVTYSATLALQPAVHAGLVNIPVQSRYQPSNHSVLRRPLRREARKLLPSDPQYLDGYRFSGILRTALDEQNFSRKM